MKKRLLYTRAAAFFIMVRSGYNFFFIFLFFYSSSSQRIGSVRSILPALVQQIETLVHCLAEGRWVGNVLARYVKGRAVVG